jgi:hypothetical protein
MYTGVNAKLVLSQSNVRRIKAGVWVEALAEDIARRGLLQSLNVRPVPDEAGVETGKFEISAGDRRSAVPGVVTAGEAEAVGRSNAWGRAAFNLAVQSRHLMDRI